MLHNQWLQTSGARQVTSTLPSPQVQPPVSHLEVPPPITQILTINTPPDFSQSQQLLHSTPLDTSFNAGSAVATLQSISRAPPPTTASARETAYNPDNNPGSTFPIWAHERCESVRNASPEVQNEARIAPQIFSPQPTNTQPISMTVENNPEQSSATAPLPRAPHNPANTSITYQGPPPGFNQYQPYWGFPPFPPPGFGGASPQYANMNPWNLGFTNCPMGGFQPYAGAYNIPLLFPGGYAPNWPNNPPPPMNFPPGPPGGNEPPGPPGDGPPNPGWDSHDGTPHNNHPPNREAPRFNNQSPYQQRPNAECKRFEREKQLLNKEVKIDIRKPEPFTGTDTRKWKDYVSECITMFQAKPTTYALEHDQVLFATSWLKDNALRHWTALLQNNPDHPALHQWRAYIKDFTSIFGPHNAARDAEIALVKLKMFDNNRFSNFLV